MRLQPSVQTKLEGILTALAESIAQVKDTDTNSMFYIHLTVYRWDDTSKTMKACK